VFGLSLPSARQCSGSLTLLAYSGGGGSIVRPPPLCSDRKFLDNFCTDFVSFVLRLNRKIRGPRLLPVKSCVKVIILGTKMIFSGERPSHRRRVSGAWGGA